MYVCLSVVVADLHLTLCITPICLQTVGERDQRPVIVNLQRTPLDPLAKLLIHAKCDDVSRLLMTKLGLPIPQFTLKRFAGVRNLLGGLELSAV